MHLTWRWLPLKSARPICTKRLGIITPYLKGNAFVTRQISFPNNFFPKMGPRLPHTPANVSRPAGLESCNRERYNCYMARGWESKSVEAQQDEATARTTSDKPHLTREAATDSAKKRSCAFPFRT